MKSVAVISLLAVLASGQQIDNAGIVKDFEKGKSRQEIGHKLVPGGTAPQSQQLVPRFTEYHSSVKRTKVRYGPYRLPSTESGGAMAFLTGEKGTMTTIAFGMKKPCDGQCNLIMAQAGLEYANGTVADNSNGAWLHHIVMLTAGTGRKDNVCGQWILPGERFFSSGNERTPTTFGDVIGNKVKSAFPLSSADSFSAQLELMNLDKTQKSVYLTVDWEYIPGPRPSSFKIAKAMWLDVTNCGISSVPPPGGKSAFTLTMRPWTATFTGEMLGVGGHLHDGGTHVNIYKNNKVICKSKAEYGKGESLGHAHVEKSGGGSGGGSGKAAKSAKGARAGKAAFVETVTGQTGLVRRDQPGTSSDGKAHIIQMGTCTMMGPIAKGDKIHIDANYDFKAHDKGAGAVMGIAILYAAANPN